MFSSSQWMHRAFLTLLLFGAFFSTTASVSAQAAGPYAQAWVDPVNGNNVTGTVLAPGAVGTGSPFLTIQAAITACAGSGFVVPGVVDAIVWAAPGTYLLATTITMADGVHLMSSGDAKETVLRDGGIVPILNLFRPTAPTGTRVFSVPLVDFSLAVSGTRIAMNGFTLQGGDVQVYSETQGIPKVGRISNCIFDMRSGIAPTSPIFGIQMVSTYVGAPLNYNRHDFQIFNNTFIQGRQRYDGGGTELALFTSSAICDVNIPAPVGGPTDPNPTLRGVGFHSIQNNLFRDLSGLAAMLGINAAATGIGVGTTTGQTNAFVPGAATFIDPTGTFQSAIVGATPTPRVALTPTPGGIDPPFVGEYISFLGIETRDWRRLPGCPLTDQGSSPAPGAITPGVSSFNATNGNSYSESLTAPSVTDVFRWDGEGYGNPRTAGAETDIGYDEQDTLLVAGSYGDDTRSHNNPCEPTDTPGFPFRFQITPVAGTCDFWVSSTPFTTPAAWTNGEVPPATAPIPLPLPPFGFVYLDLTIAFRVPSNFLIPTADPNLPAPIPTTIYTNPIDAATYTFGEILWTAVEGSCDDLAQQIVHTQPNGTVVVSNLQRERF